jgi:predicted metal-dependent phosphoesterase TrpH
VKIDHHLHTTRYSPDSSIEPEELIERAVEHGLDAVVITEHDAQWTSDELDDLSARANGLVVLSGVEVSAREGHFLVYGLPDFEEVASGIHLRDLIKVVKIHQAAIVAAHPYRWDQDFDAILAEHGPEAFDALELVSNNVTPEMRPRILEASRIHGIATTGSSDAHEAATLGCYFTEFDRPIRSMRDFVAALKSRSGRPGHREGASLATGPVLPIESNR